MNMQYLIIYSPPNTLNFLDKKDTRFRPLQATLDSYFHKLHLSGLGRQIQHAETISAEEEDRLWETGVLNTKPPRGF